jgi:AraC-like DNA-binding protein
MAGFRHRSQVAPVDLSALPHPAVTLVVVIGDGPLVVDDAAGGSHRGSLVAGLTPGRLQVSGTDIECVQVRLAPLVAYRILPASPEELNGAVVALDDIWGSEAGLLAEQLHDSTSWDHRFTLIQTALARRHEGAHPGDPELAGVWERMVRSHGQIGVGELADATGWSRKRLWSRFREQIGLPPKVLARLVRFDHAAHRLASGVTAARVAAEGGYADQSHLHRDIMAFAGTTPSAVAAAQWLAVDDVAWPGG